MGFFAMCLVGYKILVFLALSFIGFGAIILPVWWFCEDDCASPMVLSLLQYIG